MRKKTHSRCLNQRAELYTWDVVQPYRSNRVLPCALKEHRSQLYKNTNNRDFKIWIVSTQRDLDPKMCDFTWTWRTSDLTLTCLTYLRTDLKLPRLTQFWLILTFITGMETWPFFINMNQSTIVQKMIILSSTLGSWWPYLHCSLPADGCLLTLSHIIQSLWKSWTFTVLQKLKNIIP